MEPSSLIFLVIIGIWAAYFVQYWVRRREHLATIRSVDAFSETMRVLQVRAPLPSVDDGGRAPRTYAVSPARAMRPQVTVKRAEAYAAQPLPSPAPATRPTPSDEVRMPTMHPSRATRGVVLLVGLAGTVVFGVLAAVGVLVWWSFVVPLVMAVAGFAWLRAGVQAQARARRAARGRARRAAASATASTRVAPRAAAATTRAVAAPASRRPDSAPATEQAEPARETAEPASAPYDVSAESSRVVVQEPEEPVAQPAAQHEVALPQVDEDDIPLTWDPRPVPRPTYTMKARAAERPAPAPLAQPAALGERTAYEDEAPQRRIAGA